MRKSSIHPDQYSDEFGLFPTDTEFVSLSVPKSDAVLESPLK